LKFPTLQEANGKQENALMCKMFLYNNFVKNVYTVSGGIVCSQGVASAHKPVIVTNSRIEEIDGLYIDYVSNIDVAVTISDSDTQNATIKNIQFTGAGTREKCVIDSQMIN